MSAARNTIKPDDPRKPRLVKGSRSEPFDIAKSLRNIANGHRIIAAEYEKLAEAGLKDSLENLGVLCHID